VSTRTLRRRLSEEGSSYREIVDEVRADLARHHLAREKRDIDDVAFLLGFSDQSAFTKAFRRWTGRTPADYARRR
jgi:AraC-like DNA-binding protein